MSAAYMIARLDPAPALEDAWTAAAWEAVEPLDIASFHPQSSGHHPRTQARLGYDAGALHVIFGVDDRHVRCTHTHYQDPVYEDSCVELFVQPRGGRGYFNLEFGCGGALLLSWIEDPRRTAAGFERWTPLPAELGARVAVHSSLDGPAAGEIAGPLRWELAARIPYAVFEPFIGAVAPRPGDCWRGNLFKCADASSRPHWASWAPIGDTLDFHQPDRFGELSFG